MTELLAPTTAVLDTPLAQLDPEVAAALDAELARQRATLEMIASENFAPLAVMEAQGSVLTNKYAEGYPGRRYYGGCEHVDAPADHHRAWRIDRASLPAADDHRLRRFRWSRATNSSA